MAYVDGFVIAVPKKKKEEFIDVANFVDPLFIELGAKRVVECWGDELPEGAITDFRKAVQATDDETVCFSWVEWPDKETRDKAQAKMHEMASTDERWDAEKHPPPFDGKRMIMGGFTPVFEM